MKKLMLTAGAAAIAAGAFATAPTVYDYKASVKHMYLKEITVRDTSFATPQTVHVYQKIQKTSTLRGYLVQDTQACLGGRVSSVAAGNNARAWDQRRNRAFLVVLNSSATPAAIRQPKIMPAVLEAKYMDKALNNRSYLTEGTLFVGGELVAFADVAAPNFLRPYLMPGTVAANTAIGVAPDNYNTARAINQSVENPTTARARQTAKAYYGDYLWTSAYLFGQYNGPQWSVDNWGVAEAKVIAGMPAFMKPRSTALAAAAETIINPAPQAVAGLTAAGMGHGYFHDTWMNHAGFGTGVAAVTPASICCGISTPSSTSVALDSLSGNMKGGLFICSENGFYTGQEAIAPYGVYRGGALWDDQFWSASINGSAGDVYPANAYFGTFAAAGLWNTLGNGDNFQMDVWTDGDIETFTTDVMSGTWSIKRNTRLAGVALTLGEICGTFRNIAAPATASVAARPLTGVGTAQGFVAGNAQDVIDFNAMLKGAALNLSRTVIFANGTEISAKVGDGNRFTDLPMITPKFATTYGLDGQQLYVANSGAVVLTAPNAANSVYTW